MSATFWVIIAIAFIFLLLLLLEFVVYKNKDVEEKEDKEEFEQDWNQSPNKNFTVLETTPSPTLELSKESPLSVD